MRRWQGQYELRSLQNGYDKLCRKGSDTGGNRTARRADAGEEKQYGRHLILVLILAAGGGGALWYFKLRKPKSSVKGSDELDEFDFDEDDEAEEYGDYEDADSASDPDEQENEE